jgi:hypothetical protein
VKACTHTGQKLMTMTHTPRQAYHDHHQQARDLMSLLLHNPHFPRHVTVTWPLDSNDMSLWHSQRLSWLHADNPSVAGMQPSVAGMQQQTFSSFPTICGHLRCLHFPLSCM